MDIFMRTFAVEFNAEIESLMLTCNVCHVIFDVRKLCTQPPYSGQIHASRSPFLLLSTSCTAFALTKYFRLSLLSFKR